MGRRKVAESLMHSGVERGFNPSNQDGNWLRDQLDMHNVLQKDLASAIHMDPSTVSRVIAGRRRLRPGELHLAQSFFNDFGQRAGNRLAEALTHSRWSSEALARATGIARERIILLSSHARMEATDHEDQLLTRFLGLERGHFLGPDAPDVERSGAVARSIPIHAAPRFLGDGWFAPSHEVADERPLPRGLERANGAYGIFIDDEELAPHFIGSSIIYVHPLKGAGSGRMAMVEAGERVAFGRIASMSATEIVLESGRRTLTIARDDRVRTRTIVGIWFE